MKKKYSAPSVDIVKIRMIGSILDDENAGMANDSEYANTVDSNEQLLFESFEDETPVSRRNSLWDE